jgi:hypothetical protein
LKVGIAKGEVMKKKIFVGFAILALSMLPNCETQPSGYQETSPRYNCQYFPLNIGNRWTYNATTNGSLDYSFELKIEDYRAAIFYDIWIPNEAFSGDSDGAGDWGDYPFFQARDDYVCFNRGFYYSNTAFLLSDSMQIGQAGGNLFNASGVLTDFIEIDVPAGHFTDVMHFHQYTHGSTSDEGWSNTCDSYYAPGVGLVKSRRIYWYNDHYGSSTTIWEQVLTDYQINPR